MTMIIGHSKRGSHKAAKQWSPEPWADDLAAPHDDGRHQSQRGQGAYSGAQLEPQRHARVAVEIQGV